MVSVTLDAGCKAGIYLEWDAIPSQGTMHTRLHQGQFSKTQPPTWFWKEGGN